MLKKGLDRSLMQKIFDSLEKCEGRMSEVLIDSATDESETKSPIIMTRQGRNDEKVCLSGTRKPMIRSKLVIEKMKEMKTKLGSKVIIRKSGKTKLNPEPPAKTTNST